MLPLAKTSVVLAAGFAVVTCLSPSAHAQPPERQKGATVIPADHQDVSQPLREIKPIPPDWNAHLDKREKEKPKPFRTPHQSTGPDQALQTSPGPLVSVTAGQSFDGVGEPGYEVLYAPPDTNGSVGRTISGVGYYIQWVNVAFGIFNKANGVMAYGPANGNTLWFGFGGRCEADNDGDPIVIYDKLANRWIFTQFSVSAQPYMQCVAVSKTSDPLGQYNRYSFTYGNLFNDYPKIGVWPDAYYINYNMFTNGQTFAGGETCALDRTAMLNGQAATQQCFIKSNDGGMLPADLDGTTLPPTGTPNFVMSFGTDVLNLYRFHVDWSNPANSTFTGPIVLPVTAFSEACNGGTCVPQASTKNKLDSLGDRLMYRLAYRRFADGHDALVFNHSVGVAPASRGKPNPQTGVRWYEVRNAGGTPTVFQQGTYAPDASYRWMGSAAMDKAGNIAVGYSVSSSSLRPGIRFTGRGPGDPLGTLGVETSLLGGTGSQTGSLHRWGDYSSLSVDPDDDCTFWYTNEYLQTTGSFNWSTRIGSFKLNGCQ
jgi:hypothetical protein